MSKIESALDKTVAKLPLLKNWVMARLCKVWHKISPTFSLKQKLDYPTGKALVLQYKWRIVIVALILFAGSKAYDYFFPPSGKAGAVQTITSMVTEKKDIPLVIEATGTIVSNSIVDIRPMVTNKVDKIHIIDGQDVKAGELLFTLDNRTDTANYEKLKALADDAQKQYLRAKELVTKNFISKAGLETALANAKSAQAAAETARVQLSFDFIRSPIDGKAGIINVFPGTLVQASNTVISATNASSTSTTSSMVTITQLNPINVQFVIPEKDIPILLESKQSGTPMKVQVTVGNNTQRVFNGEVLVVDNQIDPQIAAVRVKAQIPNEKYELLPGQFARVSLNANTLKDVIAIPSEAIVMNPKGRLVYIVDKDGKVAAKPITVSYEYQGTSVVNGLEVGQRIVVEGKQNLRTGSKVREAKPANTPAAQAK
ncbi:MAG: efflux transporter periplasmic adaptor subunit [Polynucleobacter sp. 24-46-87]|uniref:efflux RND transporter periplasmic adaptor subunit n=1 Tax=Polynucleobacter sp. 35-46-11 TaxID=1970425 RepID=UPI000BCDA29E|nr:efflux RND transporter periplasmic adaptor subunit [Polynucleobacter sp. 35-46-11]OYY17723.1 MAG: efflux transporter periplasmic adaptor subunit [Polynucleobacter sp. 35-46-11]OZA14300.1 MAG: efflux transporter periplasmic adaptor subunit [Polynucleobacter sp. 24-46-87]